MDQTYNELVKTAPPVTHNAPLTSSEIGNLSRTYVNYSMLGLIMKFFLQHVQDVDIRSVIEDTLSLSEDRVRISADFLSRDGRPVPYGFTEQDVDLKAPALFADVFYLHYVGNMIKLGLNISSMALTMAARLDVIDIYHKAIDTTMDLWEKAVRIMLEKGVYTRPPFITTTDQVEFVKSKDFLAGHRPLLAIEIEQLYFGIITNEVGRTLLTGFHQVVRSKEARKYIKKGLDFSSRIIDEFSTIMRSNGITSPMHWDAYSTVTNSTTPPFSDKMMMFHVLMMNAAGIANYAISLASSPRRDLASVYGRLIAKTADFANDGFKIMIENGWLEEPPSYIDRTELRNTAKH
ncbi:DUF3231 family protein [Pelotomaculum propionicicum]|uniref:DUF3231 family protein n=1 Tax=Pelotomaculum propionicicum TaxID=258475 RepID=UPI003B7AB902